MHTHLRWILAAAFGIAGLTANAADADHARHHDMGDMSKPAMSADSTDAWMAAAKAAYPLDTCVVSGDKLEDGAMGSPIDFVYKQEGKPDRLVRFCCKDCVRDFNRDPDKYLAKIDAAAAKMKGKEKPSDMHEGHAGHAD